ncbi:MAG: TIR domain-containing protein [Pyrinomonadaceae bacterium]
MVLHKGATLNLLHTPHGPKVVQMIKPTVFIIYSHMDEEWKDRVVNHLGVLRDQGLIEIWEDRQISAGADWHADIQAALHAATIAVLLISANSLTSDYFLHAEVAPLIERGAKEGVRVFPLVVEPCAWQTVPWLRQMNLRPKDGRPLSAGDEHQINVDLAALAEEIYLLVKRAASTSIEQSFVPLNPDDIAVARLPDRSRELFGRELEMELLDGAWADRDTNVISIVAFGGVGKSALVNHWQHRMGRDHYRGAEKVYAWSFYRQGMSGNGVSTDEFITKALDWFGDDPASQGSPWGKGERLAKLIKKQRTLLILDGLEPLQEPPGNAPRDGMLKDQSMIALLRGLANVNPGLCVITSQLPVSDLDDCQLYKARRINLEHLSPKAGARLLEEGGVVGEKGELQQASIEFGGHALALTLLGSYLRIVYGGQIARRDGVDILKEDEEQGGHASRVMAAYERWFTGRPELAVLRMIALFDRPAEGPAIAALRARSDIPNLTEPLKNLSEEDWQRMLDRLRRAKLIAEKDPDDPEVLDAHPLVRAFFKKQLKQQYPDAWRRGNDQLFEYLSGAVENRPETKEKMYFLYRAVSHACRANRHRWAFAKVYYDRIQRRREFFAPSKLGTVGADVAALSCFFDVPWIKPVATITGKWKALLFGQAGYRLWMDGRLEEAVTPMREALEADVNRGAWSYASIDADSLASICMSLGDLTQALNKPES